MAQRIMEAEEKRMWHEMSEVERQKMEQRCVLELSYGDAGS